jgi:hypothetical protein
MTDRRWPRLRTIPAGAHDLGRYLARRHGLEFARAMLKIGHPVAVFLNLDAVQARAARGRAEKRSVQQIRATSSPTWSMAALVLICARLEEFGLRLDDVVPGVHSAGPAISEFVFADNVRTLTW